MRASDRRFARRYSVGLPMRFKPWNSGAPEETVCVSNVSERGLFFETVCPPPVGSALKMWLEMPPEVTGVAPVEWSCLGTVVHTRPVNSDPNRIGVGVRLEFYEALSAAASTKEFFT